MKNITVAVKHLWLRPLQKGIFLFCAICFAFNGYSQTQTYSTPGTYTFTVPAGVTSITAQVWGAGGGGSSASGAAGGGGGGGYTTRAITVTAGSTITVIVGAGGGAGVSGGLSQVTYGTTILTANGGTSTNSTSGGTGGTATGGTNNYTGGNGGSGNTTRGGGGGGGSSARMNGTGDNGDNASSTSTSNSANGGSATNAQNGGDGGSGNGGTDATAGTSPGGGGGGKGGGSTTSKSGGDGQVKLTWTCGTSLGTTSTSVSSSVCPNTSATVAFTSTSLTTASYTVYYNLSGANTATAQSASLSFIGYPTRRGTFSIPAGLLTSSGPTTVTITSINCANLTTNNTATFNVNAAPTSNISGSQTICGSSSVTISIALTGTAPWSLTYTDGTTPVNVSGITSSPYTFQVSPASPKTYTVSSLSDANCSAQASGMTGSAVVSIYPNPLLNVAITSAAGAQFSDADEIFHASASAGTAPYTYSWAATNANGSYTFTPSTGGNVTDFETTITNSAAYNIAPTASTIACTVTDANNCTVTNNTTTTIYPNIQAPSGSVYICQGTASSDYTTSTTMPFNSACDVNADGYCSFEWQIESVPSGTTVGTITPSGNSTATVTWDAGFFGTARIKVRAVGTAGRTQTSDWVYTDVTITTSPTAELDGSDAICNGSTSSALKINLEGTAPYTIVYNDGTTNNTITNITSAPYFLNVNPTATTTYSLVSASDAACAASPADVSGSGTVTVNSRPTSVISGMQTICNGSSTNISIAFTGTAPFNITYSDGTTPVTINGITANPYVFAVSPATTKTYTVTALSDANCASQAGDRTGSATITVNQLPTASAGGSQTICQTGSATVSGASYSDGTILWTSDGAGSLSGETGLTPTYTPAAADAGSTVTLTMTVTSNNTCAPSTASAAYTVNVNALPTAIAGGSQTICQNGAAIVSGASSSNGTILWTHNGSGSLSNATTLTPTYTAAAGDAGHTVTLTMTVSNSPCVSTATYSVAVSAMPTATTTGSSTICENGNVTLASGRATASGGTINWTGNGYGSITAGGTTNRPTYTAATGDGGNTVTLTMSVTNGACVATATYPVVVNPLPIATAGGSTTVCYSSGTTVTVSGASASNGTIQWADNSTWANDGDISSGSTTLTPTYRLGSGDVERTVTLTMTVTSNNACASATATATYSVIVKGTPSTAVAGADQTSSATCGQTTVTLAATAPTRGTGMWSIASGTGGSFANPSVRNTTFTGVSGNSYVLKWTVSNNPCTASSDNMNVTLNPLPAVAMSADYCAVGGKVLVTGTSSITPATYQWSTGAATQSIQVDVAGNYVVTASVTSTGCTASGNISIAQELVTNGNFSSGATGFTTDPQYTNQQSYYNGNATSGLYPEGLYAVNTNAWSSIGNNSHTCNPPQQDGYHPTFFGHDHTTGTGNFMMVNGNAPTNGVLAIVWQEGPFTVLPNTDYYFSAWAMSLNNVSPYASLRFSVNGTQVGSTATLGAGPADDCHISSSYWTRFYGVWNSGSNTTATVSIVDLQTAAGGNDFGLDDISFGTLSTFVTLTSDPSTNTQTVCANSPITDIAYSVGSDASGPVVNGLPSGITSAFNGITLTIKGTPTVAGSYTYTVISNNNPNGTCPPATATGTITVNPLPSITITNAENSGTSLNDGIICNGDGVTLTATPSSGVNYVWSTSPSATADNISVSPAITTSYTVTVTDATTGCLANKSQTITVNNLPPTPTVTIIETSGTVSGDGIICNGASATLTASSASGVTYLWSAPISAAGSSQSVSPSATTSYNVTATYTSNACSASASTNVTVNPLPVQTTVLADCMFVDSLHLLTSVDSNIVIASVGGGTAPYTFIPPSSDKLRAVINSTQQAFTAPADNTPHTYTIKDALGCSQSTSVTTANGNPTNIPYTASIGNETTECYIKNFNKWTTFRDTANNAILSINDDNLDLGLVSVVVYKEGSEPQVLQTGTGANCQGYYSTALKRHFIITSTAPQPFANDVQVRLYFTDDELQSLISASLANNAADTNDCRNVDDVYSIDDLFVTKYDDPNPGSPTVDGDYTNNLPAAAGGIYKVYGNPTNPYRAPDGALIKKQAGFASYFPNGQANHYVQLSVREFSELWLHGSNNGTALPVQMLYLEAEAINNEYIQLRWATALEINNAGFKVERSTDGATWSQIGWVDGNDNKTTQTDYSYNDITVQPNVRYYYRLKQTDNDGAFQYTDIVSAMLRSEASISVKDFIPNPATDKTNLIITTTNEQKIGVDIYDILGQKVYSSSNNLNNGANRLEFDTKRLASGTYTAIITAGEQRFAKKLVVTK